MMLGSEEAPPSVDVDGGGETFEAAAVEFLQRHAPRRRTEAVGFGVGDDTIAVMSDLSQEEEAESIAAARRWRRLLFDHGLGWVDGPPAHGGRGLGRSEAVWFRDVQRDFDVPDQACFIVGLAIVAPAILAHGSAAQKDRYLRALHRGDLFACQLFSEPGHGSDLAGIATRAVPDGDEWIVSGQKVWNSYAQYSDVGLLLARTDTGCAKHRGLTMFLLDMHEPGVEVRPLRQMTGAAHFNEVFLSEVRVPDSQRLGPVGEGWRVTITTLMSEREAVGVGDEAPPETLERRLVDLHHAAGGDREAVAREAVIRQAVARAAALGRVLTATGDRLVDGADGHPGPEMSMIKLLRNQFLAAILDTGCAVAGPGAVAEAGAWGRFAWGRARLAAPGLRIAGGTDEIQRTILAERVLGLPKEPSGPGPSASGATRQEGE